MNYFRVEVTTFRKSEWIAFVSETCSTLKATSRKELEAAVSRHLEETLGEKRYQIIWLG